MLDPIAYSPKVQQAVIVVATCAAGIITTLWLRLLRGERSLLEMPFHRRSEDIHARGNYISKGAQWNDHYGRRSHDIDVEHMR